MKVTKITARRRVPNKENDGVSRKRKSSWKILSFSALGVAFFFRFVVVAAFSSSALWAARPMKVGTHLTAWCAWCEQVF